MNPLQHNGKWWLAALAMISLMAWGCGSQERPQAFHKHKRIGKGTYFRILEESGRERSAAEGEVARFHVSIYRNDTLVGSSWQEGTDLKERRMGTDDGTPVYQALTRMKLGDSASVAIFVDSLEVIPEGFASQDWMELRLRLYDIQNSEQRALVNEKHLRRLERHPNGQFFWKLHRLGRGSLAQAGDQVKVFLTLRNGDRVTYSTDRRNPDMFQIPPDSKDWSPLHLALQTMSLGDSITAAFEISKLSESMKLAMNESGYYDGDVMVMTISLIGLKPLAMYEAEQKAIAEAQKKQAEALKKRGREIDADLFNKIKAYKAKNIPNLESTTNGVKYVIHKRGTGAVAQVGSRVALHYTGFLTNQGQKFDSSYERGAPLEVQAGEGEVILGLDEILTTLPAGTTATIFVPYHLAYGEAGLDERIPPYANLAFHIELL